LTNEGIEYLRQYLHLPSEIVPSTLKRTARSDAARPRAAPRSSDGPKSGEDRQAYRRAPGQSSDKKADVGAGAGELELVSHSQNIL
jgi:small subunit ribosomal protein S10e